MVVNMKNPHVFPNDLNSSLRSGMTLRDYFAAKAMQGLLSNPKLQAKILAEGGCASGWIETSAWAFADEMLKAREQ
jgi:hypothetical protein